MRRVEIYLLAISFEVATCQFLEVYLKHFLFFRIFVSYCIYENTEAGILKSQQRFFQDTLYLIYNPLMLVKLLADIC